MQTMVAVLIYAGLRRAEITWLTPDDVDLNKRLIYVRAKTVNGESWQPKTKVDHVVPISNALSGYLSNYRRHLSACPWKFPSPEGCRWDPDNWSQRLAEFNRAHEFHWTALDYRHTFGSQLAQKGESLFKISTLLGNSPEICRRHYARLVPEEMHDVVEFGKAPSTASVPSERRKERERKVIHFPVRRA